MKSATGRLYRFYSSFAPDFVATLFVPLVFQQILDKGKHKGKMQAVDRDGIRYSEFTKDDYDLALDMVSKDFFTRDPVVSTAPAVAGAPESTQELTSIFLDVCFQDALSVKAMDMKNGPVLAGVLLSHISWKDSEDPMKRELKRRKERISEGIMEMMEVLYSANSKTPDVFRHYGVDEMAFLYFMNVRKEYAGRGIAKELVRLSLNRFRVEGIKVVKAVVTNPITEHIVRQFGFEQLAQLPVGEFTFRGEPFFLAEPDTTVSYFIKRS